MFKNMLMNSFVGLDIPVIVMLANSEKKKNPNHIEIWTPVSRRPKNSGDKKIPKEGNA